MFICRCWIGFSEYCRRSIEEGRLFFFCFCFCLHIRELQQDWSEDCLIGKIIYDHREALIKAYPPYVNFFEKMKEALQQCDVQNPRFHAFLKINQAKAECGRQTLQELMIRPVQRLPSVSLLISGESNELFFFLFFSNIFVSTML